jgi:hypothetical protein
MALSAKSVKEKKRQGLIQTNPKLGLAMVFVQIRPEDGSTLLVFDRIEMRRRIDERNVVLLAEVNQLTKGMKCGRASHTVHVDELCKVGSDESRVLDI